MWVVQAEKVGWTWIAALLFSGCVTAVPNPIPVGGQAESLAESGKGLTVVDQETWEDAPAGCEDRLEPGLHYALAEGSDGLVVALDGDDVLCVDTLLAIEEALTEEGDEDAALHLHTAYQRTLVGIAASASPGGPGGDPEDPSPQPNLTASTSDPSPQPNRPTDGTLSYDPNRGDDPSPQPNRPIANLNLIE